MHVNQESIVCVCVHFYQRRMLLRRLFSTSLVRPLAAASLRPLDISVWCRSIITVNVHAPPSQSGNDFRAEVKRNEEIASAKFNRLVQTEIKMGTAPPPGRRFKRYSRYTKPKERRRIEGALAARVPPPPPPR